MGVTEFRVASRVDEIAMERDLERAREARKQASALKIEGTGWDIGNAVVFLVSDLARYITGHTLVVDGGVTLLSPERDSAG